MKNILLAVALALGLSGPAMAQQITGGVTPPACTAFGTSSGTCIQGAGALGTPSSGNGTNITNVNAATLGGATFASPGTIGGTTPGAVNSSQNTTSGLFSGSNGGQLLSGQFVNVVNNGTFQPYYMLPHFDYTIVIGNSGSDAMGGAGTAIYDVSSSGTTVSISTRVASTAVTCVNNGDSRVNCVNASGGTLSFYYNETPIGRNQ